MNVFLCFVVFVAINCLEFYKCMPVEYEERSAKNIPSVELLDFMKKFGYLKESPQNAEALYTEEGLVEKIKLMQKYGGIPETGIVDNATIKLLNTPRCGNPDVISNKRNKRFIIGTPGWKRRKLTFLVFTNSLPSSVANWPPTLSEQIVKKNIKVALDTWGKYGKLTFIETHDPNADIIVAFGARNHGDNFPFDGPGNILAHAFFPGGYTGYAGDVHFDSEENWKEKMRPDEEGAHFFAVALHELGHSLGLAHSPIPNSIMFPYYKGFDENGFSLSYDDILGMYELYIKADIPEDTETNYPDERSSKESDEITTRTYPKFTTEKTTSTTTIRKRKITTLKSESTTIFFSTSTAKPTRTTPTSRIDSDKREDTVIYEGDYESVETHKEHDETHGIPPTNTPSLPNICQGHFDAVATLRNELFFFKDEYVWRLAEKGRILNGYPVIIRRMFPELPRSIKKIDAAYERPDGMIIIFTGEVFWIFNGNTFVDSPQPISNYGLQDVVKKVDAVQNWAKNGKTYLYSEDHFWRYNETTMKVDPGYPKHMERWRGVPQNLDAATTWKDGKTYFFKGNLYWKFDNDWVITTESSPMPASQTWLGCPKEIDEF